MSAWIVYSKDGRTERCRLKKLEYGGSFMNERAVTATFESESKVAFEVFDYIEYRGERFELESIPTVKKTSSLSYEYELRFVSYKYELERCEMRDIVPNDNELVYPTPLSFSFTGNVRYLAERIQANLDALYGVGVWRIVVAEGTESEEKNITIAQQNCWNALSLVNTTYELNFQIKGRVVTIGGNQPVAGHTFQYGKGNGLYEIERVADTNTGIITKLRAFGSDRNLDYSYPKKPEWTDSKLDKNFIFSPLRLMLPSFKLDGKTDYILADESVIEEYGIREASVVYDDIYPSITGATNSKGEAIDEIQAVDPITNEDASTFVVYLKDLGFDLKEHIATSPQISMKSGAMQGYTFNMEGIEKLSNSSYKITLGRITTDSSDTGNYNIPNKDWNMKAGDKFVLLGILMPQEYIRDAEERLLGRAKEYLAEYGKTNFSYNIGMHDKFLIENGSVYDSLIEGAKLDVYDSVLGISEQVTIQSLTITEDLEDNLLPQVKVTLNNKPSASTLDRIQGQIKELSDSASGSFSSQSELLQQYRKKLDKPFFDRLIVAVDANGNDIASNDLATPIAYLRIKYDLAVEGGVTMYAEGDVDVPSLAEGLPYDGRTIWFNPETQQIEVIGGTGGSGEGGTSNFWELNNIPSWITQAKPTYQYSEIKNTPDLSVYATTSLLNQTLAGYVTNNALANTLLSYPTFTDLRDELKGYVNVDYKQDVVGIKNFINGIQIGELPITKLQDDVIYIDANLVVRGGVTMFYENGELDMPTIVDEIGIAGYDGKKLGLVSFSSSQFSIDANGNVTIKGGSTGLDTEQLYQYLTSNKYATQSWVTSQGYASATTLSALQSKVNDFLEGSDTDTIINKWKELESFLSGLSESDNLADILATKANQSALDATNATVATKWTQDNNKITQWNTAYGWGNHASVGYALKSYVDTNFVTLGTKQTITGEKNFTGGLKVNNSPSIYYDATNKYWKLEGDLLVTGGVSMYSDDSAFTPSTIMDALELDNTTIRRNPTSGALEVIGGSGATVKYPLSWSGFNQGTYDGSQAVSFYIPTALSEFVNDKNFATTSDLSGYLPLNGGTLIGNITLKSSSQSGTTPKIYFQRGTTSDNYYDSCIYNKEGSITFSLYYNNTYYEKFLIGNTSVRPCTDNELLLGTTTIRWADVNTVLLNGYTPITANNIGDYAVLSSSYTASDILSKLLTVDGSGSGLDADLLDGYHADSGATANTIALRDISGALSAKGFKSHYHYADINATGWYRVYIRSSSSAGTNQIILQLGRAYNNNPGESYSFSISLTSNRVSITQLTGEYFYKYIQKIRIAKNSKHGEWYIDYYRGSENKNEDYVCGIGYGTFQVPTLVEETPIYSVEFTTGRGCKSESYTLSESGNTYEAGFVGNLDGNASSATKLQTPRTIWGQSFDGTGDVSGKLILGNSAEQGLYFKKNDGTTLLGMNLSVENHLAIGTELARSSLNTLISGYNVSLRYGTTPNVGLQLTNTGNVLIGTTTDRNYKLNIAGGSVGVAGSNYGKYVVYNSNYVTASIGAGFSGGDAGIVSLFYEGVENVRIYGKGASWINGGNLAIGKTTASYPLDVVGDIRSSTNIRTPIATIDGIPIYKKQDGVLYIEGNLAVKGGITMFAEDEVDIPSILDSLPIASTTALGIASFDSTYFSVDSNGMVSLTSAPSSGASSLGELLNVDASIDATASVDRVLYQPAGSATWTWRELPKDGVVGNYLPLSGGTLNGSLLVQANPSEWLFTAKTNTSVIYAAHADNYGIFASTKSVSSNHYLLRLHYNDHTLSGSGNIAMVVKCNGVVDIGNMSSNYALNVEGDIYGTNWLRTNKGWHNDSYGGGFYMEDTTYLRTYGGKIMYIQEDGLAGSNAYGIGGHTLQLLIGGGMSNHSSILLRSNTCGWGIASNTNGNMYIGKRPSTNPTDYSSDSYILELSSSGLKCYGGITMYSDQRKKTILNHVELSLKQIANAPLIRHYYNSDHDKTTHIGSIAQYWYEMNDWFCKEDSDGYLTMEIQNCALASAISIARELDRYETKTDKTIRKMKQRIAELEEEVERLKQN